MCVVLITDVSDLGPKLTRLAKNGAMSGFFPDLILIHFGLAGRNVLDSDLKKYQICPI